MNHILGKLMGLGGKAAPQCTRGIKGQGSNFMALCEIAKGKGLELYADHTCNCYWLWKDGNTIDGTHDPFYTLVDVKKFLKGYETTH